MPCALFHRSRGKDSSVGQLIRKPLAMTNWTRASTTLKENSAVSKTHRESVMDAEQLQKEDPALQELHDVKDMITHG